jgi:hypothetical protein
MKSIIRVYGKRMSIAEVNAVTGSGVEEAFVSFLTSQL